MLRERLSLAAKHICTVYRQEFLQALAGVSVAYALPDDRENEPKVHVHGANGIKLPLDRPVNLKIRVLDGPEFHLEAHRGMVVVLNFFATWCPPCRHEAPDFVAFAEKHADNAVVVSVDFREEDDKVRDWRKKFAVPYRLAMDEKGGYADSLNIHVFPTTLFFRPDGILSCAIRGAIDAERLAAEFAIAKTMDGTT